MKKLITILALCFSVTSSYCMNSEDTFNNDMYSSDNNLYNQNKINNRKRSKHGNKYYQYNSNTGKKYNGNKFNRNKDNININSYSDDYVDTNDSGSDSFNNSINNDNNTNKLTRNNFNNNIRAYHYDDLDSKDNAVLQNPIFKNTAENSELNNNTNYNRRDSRDMKNHILKNRYNDESNNNQTNRRSYNAQHTSKMPVNTNNDSDDDEQAGLQNPIFKLMKEQEKYNPNKYKTNSEYSNNYNTVLNDKAVLDDLSGYNSDNDIQL